MVSLSGQRPLRKGMDTFTELGKSVKKHILIYNEAYLSQLHNWTHSTEMCFSSESERWKGGCFNHIHVISAWGAGAVGGQNALLKDRTVDVFLLADSGIRTSHLSVAGPTLLTAKQLPASHVNAEMRCVFCAQEISRFISYITCGFQNALNTRSGVYYLKKKTWKGNVMHLEKKTCFCGCRNISLKIITFKVSLHHFIFLVQFSLVNDVLFSWLLYFPCPWYHFPRCQFVIILHLRKQPLPTMTPHSGSVIISVVGKQPLPTWLVDTSPSRRD